MRVIPTAGLRGECPQAAALIDGLEDVGHVIADATCDAGALRRKIEEHFGAEAHIQANPSRAIKPSLDPDLYAEHHKVNLRLENSPLDCFLILLIFQRITRFRRIALLCEKTLTSFMGFIVLVSALDWLR